MNLEYYYWYFKSAIPPKICDEIIKYGLEQQDNLALTGKYNERKEKSNYVDHLCLKVKYIDSNIP